MLLSIVKLFHTALEAHILLPDVNGHDFCCTSSLSEDNYYFCSSLKLTVLQVERFFSFFFLPRHSSLSSQTWLDLWCGSFPNLVITRRPTSEKSQSEGGYGKILCPCMPCVRHAPNKQQRHVIPCPVFDLPLLYLVSRGSQGEGLQHIWQP